MGTIFKYVKDSLLEGSEEPDLCPGCNRGAKAYLIDATPDQEQWDAYGPRVDYLCIDCIRTIPLRRLETRECEMWVQQLINAHFKKGSLSGLERHCKLIGICDEFRRTPKIPRFLQGEDWPYCCGDFMEFFGTPSSDDESMRIGREMSYWETREIKDFEEIYGDLRPESQGEVNLFRCLTCPAEVFTWQAT